MKLYCVCWIPLYLILYNLIEFIYLIKFLLESPLYYIRAVSLYFVLACLSGTTLHSGLSFSCISLLPSRLLSLSEVVNWAAAIKIFKANCFIFDLVYVLLIAFVFCHCIKHCLLVSI